MPGVSKAQVKWALKQLDLKKRGKPTSSTMSVSQLEKIAYTSTKELPDRSESK